MSGGTASLEQLAAAIRAPREHHRKEAEHRVLDDAGSRPRLRPYRDLDELGTERITLPGGLRVELHWAMLGGRAEVLAVTILGGVMRRPLGPEGRREMVVAYRRDGCESEECGVGVCASCDKTGLCEDHFYANEGRCGSCTSAGRLCERCAEALCESCRAALRGERGEPRAFPVTTAHLRTVHLQRLVRARRWRPGEYDAMVAELPPGGTTGIVTAVAALFVDKPGRRTHPGSHFEEVAQVYQAAWADHRQPTKAVQAHFNVSKSCAAKWVARCRALGLLAPTERGRANGQRPVPKTKKET